MKLLLELGEERLTRRKALGDTPMRGLLCSLERPQLGLGHPKLLTFWSYRGSDADRHQ
jgi:hypothetical protein